MKKEVIQKVGEKIIQEFKEKGLNINKIYYLKIYFESKEFLELKKYLERKFSDEQKIKIDENYLEWIKERDNLNSKQYKLLEPFFGIYFILNEKYFDNKNKLLAIDELKKISPILLDSIKQIYGSFENFFLRYYKFIQTL
jgi:hypothetical protein